MIVFHSNTLHLFSPRTCVANATLQEIIVHLQLVHGEEKPPSGSVSTVLPHARTTGTIAMNKQTKNVHYLCQDFVCLMQSLHCSHIEKLGWGESISAFGKSGTRRGTQMLPIDLTLEA